MTCMENMSPADIKQALKIVNISQAGIARDLGISGTAVGHVINGKAASDRVRRHIAKCINRPVAEIWPETYLVKSDPTKKGRPMSKGLYDSDSDSDTAA